MFKRLSHLAVGAVLLAAPISVAGSASAHPDQGQAALTTSALRTQIWNCVDVENSEVGPGSTGTYVKEVQCLLNYAINPSTYHLISEDGDFGPDTEGKVRKFQACANTYDNAGLTVDGWVGPHTAGFLQKWASSARYLC